MYTVFCVLKIAASFSLCNRVQSQQSPLLVER
jgi:hypothetical protein